MSGSSKTLVFLLTEDWFFASHFLARGVAAKAAGWRVVLLTHENPGNAAAGVIRAAGLELIPIDLNRRRLNPLAEWRLILRIARLYRELQPALVHHVAIKPILLGGIAAKLAKVSAVINAPVGLGYVFSSHKLLARVLRPFVSRGLRFSLNAANSKAIFENPDDLDVLVRAGMVRREITVLIRGAGVDTKAFAPAPPPPPPVRVILIARMIREKGVQDFVDARIILRTRGVAAEFILVGAPDPGNPDSIPEAQLRQWQKDGLVTWLGPRHDIAALLRGAHIACQPSSYREGLPKSALEAMAAGKPVVATDIPGCREAVEDGVTGLLAEPRNPLALAAALQRLIDDPDLRARMGAAARARVEREFADEIICQKTLLVYNSLVA